MTCDAPPGKAEVANGRPLNLRQRRFVVAYARLCNGTQAAITAGYSPRSARVTACRMLTNAKVAAEIEALRRCRQAAVDVEVQGLVRQYVLIAFSRVCPMDFLELRPGCRPVLRPVAEWTEEMRIMCKDARETRSSVKVALRSRDHALRMLTRYTGGFIH